MFKGPSNSICYSFCNAMILIFKFFSWSKAFSLFKQRTVESNIFQPQWPCNSEILLFDKSCLQNCLSNSVPLVLFICLFDCSLKTFRRQILFCTNISKRALINRSTQTDVQMSVLVFDYTFLSAIMGIHFKSAIIALHNVYSCPLVQFLFQTFEQI